MVLLFIERMIIDKEVTTGLNPKNIYYYEGLGYNIPRSKDSRGRIACHKGTKIKVNVVDLMPTSKVKVTCKCEKCGSERKIFYDTLAYRSNSIFKQTGETLCVKCRNGTFAGTNNPQYKHGNNRFCEYISNARGRGIQFKLTIDDFRELTSGKCHYCGGNSKDRNPKSRGNGIDRKDSNIGYIKENCVSCCATCNFVKNSMPYNEFIKYIRSLYNNTINYEI